MSDKQEQYTYKNTSDRRQALIGVGDFEPGEIFTTFEEVTNPNFTLVTKGKADKDDKTADENAAPMERTEGEDLKTARGEDKGVGK